MNFKLEKSSTSFSTNYRYTFRVDDAYVDSEHFKTDSEATEWYNKYKSVYQPESVHTIMTYEELKLERRIKLIVTNDLQVQTQYKYCIWKELSLINIYVRYTEDESDDLYEEVLSQFFKYRADYVNVKATNTYFRDVTLFDENN
jgi:hypothetical protein